VLAPTNRLVTINPAMTDNRPDPDALLASLNREEQ